MSVVGSPDLDPRAQEGNVGLVGDNIPVIPVFHIQDGIRFPDVIPAAKPLGLHRAWDRLPKVMASAVAPAG